MLETNIEKELQVELNDLTLSKQRQVLDFARSLKATPLLGVPGAKYFPPIASIDPADLAEMEMAIEEGCESIDANDW